MRVPPNIIPGLPNFYTTANVLRRLRDRRRGQAPDGPADQGGGKSSASSKPRRHRRVRAGASARFLRSGSGLGDNGARLPLRSVELADRFDGAASENRGEPRQRFPHPDRRDHLADPGRAAGCAACTLPGSPLAPVAGDLAREYFKGRCACLRRAGRIGAETGRSGRHPRHRQRSLELRAGTFALCSRLRLAPQSHAHAEDAPHLRRGADADADGSVADHRFIAGPRELHQVVMALAAGILQRSPPSGPPDWVGK